MITRRNILLLLGAAWVVCPADAQAPAGRIYRVAVIANITPEQRDALRQGLRAHGWIEGKNLLIEYRAIGMDPASVVTAARELSSQNIDCMVSAGNATIHALKPFTAQTPLVMAFAADPIGSGFATSLRRPGGNITGLTNMSEELTGKRLELLRDLDRRIARIAILKNPAIAAHEAVWREAQSAARVLGITVSALDYSSTTDIDAAFDHAAKRRVQALLIPQSPLTVSHQARIFELAANARLPVIYQNASAVESGGLISYGPDEPDMYRRAANFVDKIFKGARAGEIPIEQPTKFELAINMKTAKTLGLKIPNSILVQATKVIE